MHFGNGTMMDLDHVLIAVTDLDAAAQAYELLLGLPVAVRSDHPTYGTKNALFIPERGAYLELLAVRDGAVPALSLERLSAQLAERGPGLFGVALAPDDIDAAVARVRADGFEMADTLRGTGVSADGREREWRNTRLPLAALHGSSSLLIEHAGWDWRSDLRQPPLSGREQTAARRIDHVSFAVPDLDAASAAWERRLGIPRAAVEQLPDGGRLAAHPVGDATITLVTGPAPTEERISGLAVEVDDVAATVAVLRGAGIAVSDPHLGRQADTLVASVSPAAAHGVPLRLVQWTR